MTRKTYNSATLRGKLRVCRYLSADDELRELVPRTVRFTRKGMLRMFERCTALYVKPDVGSLGMGIFKVTQAEGGCELLATVRRKQSRKTFDSIETAYGHMKAKAKGPMIVQAAVELDTVEGSPYDLRVMVQRKPGGKWTVTGKFAKIGVKGKIVTNYAQGGRVVTLPELWYRRGLSEHEGERRDELLERKALGIARLLSGKRAGMREMGVDFAFDRSGRLWVLEVNSNHPQYYPLRNIDRRAYKRMKRFAASYGRFSSK
ncbi:YheC/YheD family protein [Paenibacillus methanolicus]|uniref:YheC/D-like protein n=1 Tax=Paenibacillus methanolicus TaxID=582686 RepID=A0A5S5BMZ9_9BACL|nr:YheC/YheD family protein [Paenibacillus methanolicus]TYP68377.1 YheC/D-like protein [Paenibacillus methanolicus]